jgi:hypothetical protein
MNFPEWIKREGKGALSRVMYDSRVSYMTVLRARDGHRVKIDIARKLSRATGGEVSVAELVGAVEDAA